MQMRLEDAKEKFDAGLENSLSETLKKYQQQSTYWTEKLTAANDANGMLRVILEAAIFVVYVGALI